MQNGNDSTESIIEIDLNPIRIAAEKIGPKYYQIKSIYLFGSVARGDADKKSDIDLFFLVIGKSSDFITILSHDEDYGTFEDWAFEKVEGGVNPIVCNRDELIHDFDTLTEKILLEGIRLYGQDIKEVQGLIQDKEKKNKANLLDLVRSL